MATKLRKPTLAPRQEPVEVAKAEDGLDELLGARFSEVLAAGQWWGAVAGDVAGDGIDAILAKLARNGARCACVAARCGQAGYFSILAHPADAKGWASRQVSHAIGWGKRVELGDVGLLFLKMGPRDFPNPPKVFGNNESEALAASLAKRERDGLEAEIRASGRAVRRDDAGRL